MSEETKPVETVSDAEIKAVEKELQVQDSAKMAKIKEDLAKEFEAKLASKVESINQDYSKKLSEELNAHKAKIEGEYSSKFVEVEKKLEELKPRKGLAAVPSETPYEQIQREEQKQNQPERKVTRQDLLRPSKQVDIAGAERFLANLRK